LVFFCVSKLNAAEFFVNSQSSFNNAQNQASEGDQIIWNDGTYSDIFMDITQDGLVISAETSGDVVFNGDSRIQLSADNTVLDGFQFLNGNIGTEDVINVTGSTNLITQINIQDYISYKYLRIRESSQYCEVSYCNFENRINLDDQNILSVLVDENQPGYHIIRYCSFKNFDGTGNDMGIEPIRIGLSTQANRISRTLVEYCYFTQCNGDGELISSKATQNVYRYNTFENNPLAELVLRHGSEGIVYGNFFLNGKGGVRVREGQDHYIYNNYFHGIDDRAIFLQNEDSDPLDNINIGFNTLINCSFSNNIFTQPDINLFEDPTGNETWVDNICFGSLGFPVPDGITIVDPELLQNSLGYFGLTAESPAKNEASSGYSMLPNFIGIEGIDSQIEKDLMLENRPSLDHYKDIGCLEFPHQREVHPFVTESNTGPCYISPAACLVESNVSCKADFNDDGSITAYDLTQLLAVYGFGCQ